jgi:hypothetical protein
VYYYALAAVDGAGDESAKSAPAAVSVPAATESSNAVGGGGGCFISAASRNLPPELFMRPGVIALLVCLIWTGRGKKGAGLA